MRERGTLEAGRRDHAAGLQPRSECSRSRTLASECHYGHSCFGLVRPVERDAGELVEQGAHSGDVRSRARQVVVALGPGGRFRSQAGQDLYVYERFFRHRPGPGVYLEFGARDGVAHSNSYAFEQRGWRGFCVEPTDEFHQLVHNRPGCWNYHGAVAARAGARRFVFSKKGGFSGFADDMDPARLEAMRRRGKIARETKFSLAIISRVPR